MQQGHLSLIFLYAFLSSAKRVILEWGVTRLYPFRSFSLIKSHLHPKFAIVEAGRKVVTTSLAHSPQLMVAVMICIWPGTYVLFPTAQLLIRTFQQVLFFVS
jgi:hypothetical protein